MTRSLVVGVVITLSLLLTGCGGSGGDSGNPLLRSRSIVIQPTGANLALTDFGVTIDFTAGSVGRDMPAALEVFDDQFPAVTRPGHRYTKHGFTLTMTPAAVRDAADIRVTAPFAGPYDRIGTMLALRGPNGVIIALPSNQTGPQEVTGKLSRRVLSALSFGQSEQTPITFQIFTANRIEALTAPPLEVGFLQFQNGAWSGVPTNLAGKRVAFLVHGLESSLTDLVTLAGYLQNLRLPGQTQPHYDAVVGVNYSSTAPIADIGAALDSLCGGELGTTSQVDVFAHSMGNLVARYAVETASLPNWFGDKVGNFVGLGGPMAGVPLGDLSTLQSFLFLFPIEAKPCLLDLLTEGVNGQPETPLLTNLNLSGSQRGPNYQTIRMFTLSGNDYEAEAPPLGLTIHLLYLYVVGFEDVDDGLVAKYSAQSTVLQRQSQFWRPGPTLDLSHSELRTDPQALDQIGAWIRANP